MVQPNHPHVSIRHQCELLHLARSGLYYEPVEVSAGELALMKQIDELHLKCPFFGSRQITATFHRRGMEINRKRVQRLMRIMGLWGQVPGPHTSKPHPEHPIYPYLLRNLDIVRPDQVWAADITYIPLAHGWAYLVAIMDWYSRAVLAWKLSNSLSTDFCIEAMAEALRHHGPPKIFNSDQGCQFTDEHFTGPLKEAGIQISMDGKGRCLDNVFIERIWRSLKYEEVYLTAYEDLREARGGIGGWFHFYGFERPHQALGKATPMEMYRGRVTREAAAA
jgi:putative transposase